MTADSSKLGFFYKLLELDKLRFGCDNSLALDRWARMQIRTTCGAAFAYACLEGLQDAVKLITSLLVRMTPKQMVPAPDWYFFPSCLILPADFELNRPPTG